MKSFAFLETPAKASSGNFYFQPFLTLLMISDSLPPAKGT
jgi:hypothetical protein